MHLAWQLGISNTDSCCFCKDGVIAGGPVADIGNKDKLEWLVRIVNLEPARRVGWILLGVLLGMLTCIFGKRKASQRQSGSLT